MNKVVLIGNLTKDVELKNTQGNGTAVATINLAVENYNSQTKEKGADFIPVTIWGKQAENLSKYCTKGSKIAVSGRITQRSYDAKDGTKRYVIEVVADNFNGIEFLSKSNSAGGSNSDTGNSGDDSNSNWEGAPVDDGDLPF